MSPSSWIEIGSLDTTPEWHIDALVGFAGVYVAVVNDDTNKQPTIRFSADGRSWRTIELPAPDPIGLPEGGGAIWAAVGAAATDGDSVVVVGGYDHAPCVWPLPGDTGSSAMSGFADLVGEH